MTRQTPNSKLQTPTIANLKVAIVCDWLTSIGGAERVVLDIHRLFPDAPIYTSQYDKSAIEKLGFLEASGGNFTGADIRTTWLQKLPKNTTFKKFLPVLRRFAFEGLDLREYDLIISSSGAEAKAVKKLKPGAIHVCYCHSPTHYYWSRYDEYMQNPGFGKFNFLARLGLKVLVKPMRKWDYKVAQRPTYLIGNSNHIVKMIKKYYGRDAVVVHPPVDIDRFDAPSPKTREGFVITGRQAPYKRVDLAVAACTKLNLPLKVVGFGPEHENLIKMAGPTIKFYTNVSDKEMVDYFVNSQAFIFPQIEDFGITPVEAMAAGIPVIAYKAGGALDYVVPGKTGEFFSEQTVDSLVDALKKFDYQKYTKTDCQAKAKEFSHQSFFNNLSAYINKVIQENFK